MNVKEFLSQAYIIYQKINSKFEKIQLLRNLATKATATYSEMPINKNQNSNRIEKTVAKILDLENEARDEIDKLVNAKLKIVKTIGSLENSKYRRILELRYLNFKKWDEIAKNMGYGVDNIYSMHRKALKILSHKKVYSKNTVKYS